MYFEKKLADMLVRSRMLTALEAIDGQRTNVLRILAYHRIGRPEIPDGELAPPLYNATPDQFAQQMHYLAENCHLVSLEELLSALDSGKPLPPRSVMVTFDDAYRDFAVHGWHVLQKLQIPCIMFVPTDYPSSSGRMFWWDQLHQAFSQTKCTHLYLPNVGTWDLQSPIQRHTAHTQIKNHIKRIDHHAAMEIVENVGEMLEVQPQPNGTLMGWSELREMSSQGLSIGAHTCSHPFLSRLSAEEARREIVSSQDQIRQEIGHAWPIFAYPSGHPADLRPELESIMREEGFTVAMTMIEGHNVLGRTNPIFLRRIGPAPHLSLSEFRLALTGIYDVYGVLKRVAAP